MSVCNEHSKSAKMASEINREKKKKSKVKFVIMMMVKGIEDFYPHRQKGNNLIWLFCLLFPLDIARLLVEESVYMVSLREEKAVKIEESQDNQAKNIFKKFKQ
jgi:23S rRNA pseudoU1915 N3-methylase RlmH